MISLKESKIKSLQTYEEAKEFLNVLGVIEMLKPYGEIILTGSFVHGTMMKPDIDIFVSQKEILLEPLADFARMILLNPNVKRISFNNRLNQEKHHERYGVYMKIKFIFRGKTWNIDIHFALESRAEIVRIHNKEWNNVTQEEKDTIIFLKSQLAEKGLYPASPLNQKSFYSKEIYDAVVKDNVSTLDDLVLWRDKHQFPIAHFE